VLGLPSREALRTFGPFVVPPGHYFMMGDSRDNSSDSRFIGPVPRHEIVGRVARVLLSFDPLRYYTPRLQRLFRPMKLDRT
jgi:signal peptidase I